MSDPWGVPQNEQSGVPQQPMPPFQPVPGQPFGAPPAQPYPPQPEGYPGSGAYPAAGGYPAPGAPYGPGVPYGYAPVRPKPSNGIALAGAITSFVPVVGLVLSIIGRARANALAGAGKTAGTVGIVLSVLFTGGFGFLAYKLANSTAADPGCITAEADARILDTTLADDDSALTTATQSGDTDQARAAWEQLISDMSKFKSKMQADAAFARHENVHVAIESLVTDINQFINEGQQYLGGDDGAADAIEQTGEVMEIDGDDLDTLCGDATNG